MRLISDGVHSVERDRVISVRDRLGYLPCDIRYLALISLAWT